FSPRTTTFGATNNFWGNPNGPFNSLHNPNGDPANRVSNAVTPLQPFAGSAFPLTFTPPAGGVASVLGSISGTVTRADTQAPQAGVTLFLDTNGNGTLDEGEVSTTTAANGSYSFTNLAVAQSGSAFTVRVVPP